MAKTVKQIADELKIDKQKVYRYIKKKHINEVHHEAHQKNDVKYYDETAESLIKQGLSGNCASSEAHHEVHQNYINDTLLDTLLMQSETLKKELEIKNEQIKSLTERLAESQKLQAQLQQLNGIDKQRILELEAKIAEPDQEPAQASKKWWKFW